MTLEEVRAGIDAVDTQMKPLFLKRMECGKHVAEVKAQTGGDVFVLERELEIIEKRATDVDPEESAKTKKRLEEQGFGEDMLTIKLQNFCTIDEIAKEAGALLIVDNTFMTPYFQNPLGLGADVVTRRNGSHSGSKSDSITGSLQRGNSLLQKTSRWVGLSGIIKAIGIMARRQITE